VFWESHVPTRNSRNCIRLGSPWSKSPHCMITSLLCCVPTLTAKKHPRLMLFASTFAWCSECF
jgi:hypothetical protein